MELGFELKDAENELKGEVPPKAAPALEVSKLAAKTVLKKQAAGIGQGGAASVQVGAASAAVTTKKKKKAPRRPTRKKPGKK